MAAPILVTKLFIPPTRAKLVHRPDLIEHLNNGLDRKLSLLSAPAGFGKTTLVSHWVENLLNDSEINDHPIQVAWLSLDEDDNDPVRFQTYFITALNQIKEINADLGQGALRMLQSPQPPSANAVLTSLINELAALPEKIILVLDDYHLIETKQIHQIIVYLLENLPPQLHLVIVTRQDPPLSLGRLRARNQITELRAVDLRFISSEAAEFLNQIMGLNLSSQDITELETRTEGWIAGLQLAALSMRGRKDHTGFIKAFTGSNRLVLDYLVEDVLKQQPQNIQDFLMQTAILNQLTGSLCDVLTGQNNGQVILEKLEHGNLFIVALDEERRWYRYHRLFADLLRQRLRKGFVPSTGEKGMEVAELHIRASKWYEDNGLDIEAFEHAAAANDFERAARLMEGEGMPLQFRGAMTPVLNWFESLPKAVMNASPSLWVAYASTLTMAGKPFDQVEQILQSAETALQNAQPDDKVRDLIGQVASIRAMLVIPQNQAETVIAQSHRALEHLHPNNLSVRTTATWALGYVYQLRGDRAAAIQAHTEALSISQASGNIMISIAAATSLGQIWETENQLHQAVENYKSILQLAGDPPLPASCEAHLGLARIFYERNNLDAAQKYAEQSLQLALKMENVDTPANCELLLARLKLAWGDVDGANVKATNAEQFVRQNSFEHLQPNVAAVQVLVLLQKGNFRKAAELAKKYNLPIYQARVHLAQEAVSAALAVLASYREQVEAKGWSDEQLKVMVLQSVALYAHGEEEHAVRLLEDVLALTEPDGYIRIFVDEGAPMAHLLYEALSQDIASEYVQQLLAAFQVIEADEAVSTKFQIDQSELIEPLSEREIEVLDLIAKGLTNQAIATRLVLSIHTVKTHTRNIYSKLGAHHRAGAVAKARAFGIL
jgi:LuxR family maltose regulon positive regulatory protein